MSSSALVASQRNTAPSLTRLPAKYDKEVLQLHSDGKTSIEISELLNTKYNLTSTFWTVNRRLAKIIAKRDEFAKELLQDAIQSVATNDLQLVGEIIDDLAEQYYKCRDSEDHYNANQYLRTLNKYLEYRKSLFIADTSAPVVNISQTNIYNNLLSKLGD